MLKPSVTAAILFFSFFAPGTSINAQSRHRFTVHVPFQFVVNGQPLTLGNYVVERTDPARPNIVTLKRAGGGAVRVVITQRVERDSPSTESSLIFVRREGKLYLFEVWNVGALHGGQVPSVFRKEPRDRQRRDLALVTIKAIGSDLK